MGWRRAPLLRRRVRPWRWAFLAGLGAGAGFAVDRVVAGLAATHRDRDHDRFAPPAEMHPRPRWGVLVVMGAAVVVAAGLLGWTGVQNTLQRRDVARALTHGDPRRGPRLIQRYGCAGCHTIPGIPGADGKVAPPLQDLRQRVYVAGVVRNGGEALVRLIVDPPSVLPNSAMPPTGISEKEARDVAAWLYTR